MFARSGSTWRQQGSKLKASEKISGNGDLGFGHSVALSSDGSTALIGGPGVYANDGAAWVFTRSGSTWKQQGPRLTGSGGSFSAFGASVALSSDGNTAIVGGAAGTEGEEVWVFTRSGSTWTQQGPKLAVSSAPCPDGRSGGQTVGGDVAISADGNTALVGNALSNCGAGAGVVFTRSGSVWTQQGSPLAVSGGGGLGASVALSADGSTAVVTGNRAYDGSARNAATAWVFTRSGSTWTQQGAPLTGSAPPRKAIFGSSVALSADGNLALIGGGVNNTTFGAAWLFARVGSTWTQRGSPLTVKERSDAPRLPAFGASVALSSDGTTAVVGGPSEWGYAGAAWAFQRSGNAWTQQSPKLTARDESQNTCPTVSGHGPNLSGQHNLFVYLDRSVKGGVRSVGFLVQSLASETFTVRVSLPFEHVSTTKVVHEPLPCFEGYGRSFPVSSGRRPARTDSVTLTVLVKGRIVFRRSFPVLGP